MRIGTVLLPALALLAAGCGGKNPLDGIFSPENLKKAEARGVEAQPGRKAGSVILRFAAGEEPGSFRVPLPESARNWSWYGAWTFDFVSDSTIRYELRLRNRKGQETTFRVQPFERVPVKAAVPVSYLIQDFLNNRQFKGYWISNWGNHIDITDLESITVRMSPNRPVTLEIGPMALLEGAIEDEVHADKPVVDRFGQWIPREWPGKIKSQPELAAAWKREDAELARPEPFGVGRYGGWKERRVKPTGFFRTQQVDGKWWLVDPEGYLFFSTGPDCVRYQNDTRVAERTKLFAQLPPRTRSNANFYHANTRLRHGEEKFGEHWREHQEKRLRAWGFNTIANWSDDRLFFERPAMPFVANLSIGWSRRNWEGYPDAYSEDFQRSTERDAARRCDKFRNEPFLIGYFIGNEPRWPNRNLIDRIVSDTSPSDTQRFVKQFLAEKGDSQASREELMETLARRYFQVVCDAIRKADPNHLILGIRWAGSAPDPVLKANDVFDVFSINIYRPEPPAEQIDRIYKLVNKPVMIGEFHFGTAERGYAPSLVMVKDQAERGAGYQYYVERAAAQAPIVGVHYFQYTDQPVTGRFDGENYNIGFLSEVDLPYAEMVAAAKAAHKRMYRVKTGALPPSERKPLAF